MNAFNNIQIRKAKLSEAPTVSALLHDSFLEYQSFYTQKAFEASTPGVIEVEDRIADNTVWVVLLEGKIAGTVSALVISKSLFIRSMAVAAFARRAGVAKFLMKKMEKIALENDCNKLELSCTPFLIPALKLYESLGFRISGYESPHGTELVRMTKPLSILNPKSFQHDYAK